MKRRTFCRWLGIAGAGAVAGCVSGRGVGDADAPGSESDESTPGADGPAAGTDGSAAGSDAGSGEDWPTFGADGANTGVRDDGTGPSSGTIAWSAVEGAPTVLCPPTVVDGTVYTGSAANAVHAFDATTGERRWQYGTGSYVETAPTVVDGAVYTLDADGTAYSLTTDGDERWTYDTEHNVHSRTVAVRDGVVFAGTAGTMPAVVSGETDATRAGQVIALDAETGERLWTFEGPEDWFTGPAVGDDLVYVGNHASGVYALDPSTGEEAWSWSPGSIGGDAGDPGVVAPPAYRDGTVYVGVHGLGEVVALDAATGAVRWHRSLAGRNVKTSPAVGRDRVYAGVTGHERVETETESTTGDDDAASMPTVRTVGTVTALSATDGTVEWTWETDRSVRSSPAVVGNRLYAGAGDGLVALSRADGEKRWGVTFGDFVASSPAVVDGRAYVGSADGHLYCVGDP